jgi:hypothetical protein
VDKYDKKTTEWKEALPAEDSLLVIRLEKEKKEIEKETHLGLKIIIEKE